jgi:hypothetical protein
VVPVSLLLAVELAGWVRVGAGVVVGCGVTWGDERGDTLMTMVLMLQHLSGAPSQSHAGDWRFANPVRAILCALCTNVS